MVNAESEAIHCRGRRPNTMRPWTAIPKGRGGQPVKLMIHKPAWLRDMLPTKDCMHELARRRGGVEYWADERRRRSQTAHETWAWQRLETYPHRTDRAEDADMIFVPVPFMLTLDLCGDGSAGKHAACRGYASVGAAKRRETSFGAVFCTETLTLAKRFRHDPIVVANGPKVFLLHGGYQVAVDWSDFRFDSLGVVVGTHVPPANLASALKADIGAAARIVSVPQVINAHVRSGYSCMVQDAPAKRAISVYFSGSRRPFGGSIRRKLARIDWSSLPGAVFRMQNTTGASSTQVDYVNLNSHEAVRELGETYAESMAHARFCLIPSGDNAASRRMWDALASGCVPVILSAKWLNSLPFARRVNWDSLAVVMDPRLTSAELHRELAALIQTDIDVEKRHAIWSAREEFVWGFGDPLGEERRFGGATDNWLMEVADAMMAAPRVNFGKRASTTPSPETKNPSSPKKQRREEQGLGAQDQSSATTDDSAAELEATAVDEQGETGDAEVNQAMVSAPMGHLLPGDGEWQPPRPWPRVSRIDVSRADDAHLPPCDLAVVVAARERASIVRLVAPSVEQQVDTCHFHLFVAAVASDDLEARILQPYIEMLERRPRTSIIWPEQRDAFNSAKSVASLYVQRLGFRYVLFIDRDVNPHRAAFGHLHRQLKAEVAKGSQHRVCISAHVSDATTLYTGNFATWEPQDSQDDHGVIRNWRVRRTGKGDQIVIHDTRPDVSDSDRIGNDLYHTDLVEPHFVGFDLAGAAACTDDRLWTFDPLGYSAREPEIYSSTIEEHCGRDRMATSQLAKGLFHRLRRGVTVEDFLEHAIYRTADETIVSQGILQKRYNQVHVGNECMGEQLKAFSDPVEVTLDPKNNHESSLAILGVLSEVKFNRFRVISKRSSGSNRLRNDGKRAAPEFQPWKRPSPGFDAIPFRADIHQAVADLERLGDASLELVFGAEFHSAQAAIDATPKRPSSWLDSYSGGRELPLDYLPHGPERCIRFEHATVILLLEGPVASISEHRSLEDLASMVVRYPVKESMYILIKPSRSISATGRAERPSYNTVLTALGDVLHQHPAVSSGGVTFTVLDPWQTHLNKSHVAGTVVLAGARVTKLVYHRVSLDAALDALGAQRSPE